MVATANKALFAMRQPCALLGIRDPALQCKLIDTLVLPILIYGCEVLGVDTKCGASVDDLMSCTLQLNSHLIAKTELVTDVHWNQSICPHIQQ